MNFRTAGIGEAARLETGVDYLGSTGQGREIDGSRLAGTNSTTYIPTFRFSHLLAPPPAIRERSLNECCDKADL